MHCYSGHTPLALELIKEGFIYLLPSLTFKMPRNLMKWPRKFL